MSCCRISRSIMFNFDDEIHKLDKYDERGNETIEGISALTHKENFLYIEVMDGDSAQNILTFDPISQYINLDELSQSPYFHKIDSAAEIFYQTNS